MIVRLSPRASRDLDEASDWYEARGADLATEFEFEVLDALARLARFPLLGRAHRTLPGVRELVLTRVPFKLPYRITGDVLTVVAVAHNRRRPDYWSRKRGPR
jgi:plasmid stabilization system protein ParE